MSRAVRRMQSWLTRHDPAQLAEVTAPFFPDLAPDILLNALWRYAEAGIWTRTPDDSRRGFDRLGQSLLTGGFISRMPSYEQCVDPSLE